MPAADAVLASQQTTPSSGAETTPRRERKAPKTTATSAGTGGKTFSTEESTASTA
jgi:hypothetical protein